MNTTEKEALIHKTRVLAYERPVSTPQKTLASMERLVEKLPDDMPAPGNVTTSDALGLGMFWQLNERCECSLNVDDDNEMRGHLYTMPGYNVLTKFNQDAGRSVEVPTHFMAAVRHMMRDSRNVTNDPDHKHERPPSGRGFGIA